jgi:acetyltransferase
MNQSYFPHQLEAIFKPKSIALFGCSPESENLIVNWPLKLLISSGYRGKIFPINPKYEEVWGLKCYPSISAIPEKGLDLGFILLNYSRVIEVLEECAECGVKAAIIGSGGFAEVGNEGLKRQEKIKEIVRRTGIRVMGPNCLGLVNLLDGVYATFAPVYDLNLIPGRVGVIAQSGSLSISLVNRLLDKGVGSNYLISTGNEADLEACDFIEYLLHDPRIDIIGVFIESFKNPQRFLMLAEQAIELRKILVILRAGGSEKGAQAIMAHTGALAGSRQVYETALKQKGVIRAESYDDLVGIIEILIKNKLPKGNRVGIMTTSGGSAAVMADNCDLVGIKLPNFSPHIQQEIGKMQAFGTPQNPLDLTGQVASEPKLYRKCLELLLQDQNIDILLLIFTNIFGELGKGILQTIEDLLPHAEKPIIGMVTGGSMTDECIKPAEKGPFPIFRRFYECLKSIKAVADYAYFKEQWEARRNKGIYQERLAPPDLERIKEGLKGKEGVLSETESKALLAQYGIPMTREGLVDSLDEARVVAKEIGYPVAMKVISPQIPHKTEAQVIQLNVKDEKELMKYYTLLLHRAQTYHAQAEIKGILIQEMIMNGIETIVGISRDPYFGPTIIFGLGGIYVELLKDIAMRIAPVDRIQAREMVHEIKGYEILAGARGRPKGDIEGIVDVIWRLSQLALDLGDIIQAIDINPLIVLEEGRGVKGVDALIQIG